MRQKVEFTGGHHRLSGLLATPSSFIALRAVKMWRQLLGSVVR